MTTAKKKPGRPKRALSGHIKSEATKQLDSIINEEATPNVTVLKELTEEEAAKEAWAKADAAKAGKATRCPSEQLLEAALVNVEPGDVKAIERFMKEKASDLDPALVYKVISGFLAASGKA